MTFYVNVEAANCEDWQQISVTLNDWPVKRNKNLSYLICATYPIDIFIHVDKNDQD